MWLRGKFKIVNQQKIHLAIGFFKFKLRHVSKIGKVKSITWTMSNMKLAALTKFGHPFADLILSDVSKRKKKDCLLCRLPRACLSSPKEIYTGSIGFKGSWLKESEKYSILRFNSFKAHHDVGARDYL